MKNTLSMMTACLILSIFSLLAFFSPNARAWQKTAIKKEVAAEKIQILNPGYDFKAELTASTNTKGHVTLNWKICNIGSADYQSKFIPAGPTQTGNLVSVPAWIKLVVLDVNKTKELLSKEVTILKKGECLQGSVGYDVVYGFDHWGHSDWCCYKVVVTLKIEGTKDPAGNNTAVKELEYISVCPR